MPVDQELIARRTVTLKLGEAVHLDQKLVVVALLPDAVELMPLSPHDRQSDAIDSYRAGKLRAKRHRRKRLTDAGESL